MKEVIELLRKAITALEYSSKPDAVRYGGLEFTKSGKVYRGGQEVKPGRIGKREHQILTVGGQTLYLGRLIYCLFNDLNYWQVTWRIRYLDGDPTNCSLSNLEPIIRPEPADVIDVWTVREMSASGLSETEISKRTGYTVARVRTAAAGFERMTIDEVQAVRAILEKAAE
jgi:hypothetical protein